MAAPLQSFITLHFQSHPRERRLGSTMCSLSVSSAQRVAAVTLSGRISNCKNIRERLIFFLLSDILINRFFPTACSCFSNKPRATLPKFRGEKGAQLYESHSGIRTLPGFKWNSEGDSNADWYSNNVHAKKNIKSKRVI